jgi:heme A synthase
VVIFLICFVCFQGQIGVNNLSSILTDSVYVLSFMGGCCSLVLFFIQKCFVCIVDELINIKKGFLAYQLDFFLSTISL